MALQSLHNRFATVLRSLFNITSHTSTLIFDWESFHVKFVLICFTLPEKCLYRNLHFTPFPTLYHTAWSLIFMNININELRWVTHWTTSWLMGASAVKNLETKSSANKIDDLEVIEGEIGIGEGEGEVVVAKDNLLLLEKCRFLEVSGCARTCLHACKIPTQVETKLRVFYFTLLSLYVCVDF
jgi:hypothetical protein